MLKNFLLISLRQLSKTKVFSIINILGLTIGLSCLTIIVLHVENEFRYDRYNREPENVYRVVKDFVNEDGSAVADAMSPPALSPALRKELPEVDQVTRLFPAANRLYLLEYNDKRFYETRLIRVDSFFFDVFDIPFAYGEKETALHDMHSIIFTESSARKYFGSENPLGKTVRINLNNGTDYTVSAVVRDLPSQSHFHFDILIPFESRVNPDTDWNFNGFYTYARLQPHTDAQQFEAATMNIFSRYQPHSLDRMHVQPVTDIHLRSNLKWELEVNGDIDRIRAMMIIAGFIILLAGMNYVNLATAYSARRAREVGVRKATGAHRRMLILQFLCESFVVVAFALALSLIVTELLLPLVPSIFERGMIYSLQTSIYVWMIVPACALVIAFGAGLYPAFYMSSFNPVLALKGNQLQGHGGTILRKALVVCQFVISTTLVIGSLTITKQLDFMDKKDKGYQANDVMILPNVRGGIGKTIVDNGAMLNEIAQISGVERIARADGILGSTNSVNGVSVDGQNHTVLNFIRADYDYIPTLQMSMVAGRNFSPQFRSDSSAIILNEQAVKQLGLTSNSIGERLTWDDSEGKTHEVTLVGIVKDFHFRSLREAIKPFGFILEVGNGSNFFLRVASTDQGRTIEKIGAIWNHYGPERPFEYYFLDAPQAQFHQAELQFKNLINAFTLVAICIACLGLFGLISYLTATKTKEIGIRKVLGATISQLISLLARDFVILIVVALVIAVPVSWYIMTSWLETFAYRTSFDFLIPVIAGITVLVAALITIAYQIVKSALTNPVESLKSE